MITKNNLFYDDFVKGEVLLINKPLEWTSFDVVNKLKYHIQNKIIFGKLKVGHAGTLDPLATGLIIVCTGKQTKQIETYQSQTKEYIATFKFGATTPSFDLETKENEQYPYKHITLDLIKKTLNDFTGEIMQVPPIHSAIKINGVRAYKYARKGKNIELKAKPLKIDEFEILDFSLPVLKLRIVCSKGTYIRALARDIGKALNSGAYLIELQRTRIGEFLVNNAIEIEDFNKFIQK